MSVAKSLDWALRSNALYNELTFVFPFRRLLYKTKSSIYVLNQLYLTKCEIIYFELN